MRVEASAEERGREVSLMRMRIAVSKGRGRAKKRSGVVERREGRREMLMANASEPHSSQ